MRSSMSLSLNNRLKTILKKTHELSTLCDVETCVIYYAPDGTLKTWPEEREEVRDLASKYKAATKPKKSITLGEFLEKEKKNQPKKAKSESENHVNGIKYPTWYPSFDHYSSQQLDELTLYLENLFCVLIERLRVMEAQRQRDTHQSHTTQLCLDPNQFSLFMYNHGDGTLSKLPLTNYQNQQQLYGLEDHNIIQQPCFSYTQDSSALLTGQDSAVNNYLFQNNLMQQHELCG